MPKLIIYNDRWCSGGVEALWSNLLHFFSDNTLNIILLVGQKETDIYDNLLQQKNIKMIVINEKPIINPIKRSLKIKKSFREILCNERPNILHINVCNAIGLLYASIAKKAKIPCVIVHSHNTRIEHDKFKLKSMAHKAMRLLYKNCPDYKFACSTEAGKFLFGNNSEFILIKNGVNLTRFQFDEEIRNSFRRQNGIDKNMKVFCHVGRFAEQKNHKYLIKLFSAIAYKDSNSILILVGEGALKENIYSLVSELKLNNKVIFIGTTDRPEQIFFASDYFLLPSLHEGLPVTAVEAQATGIMCFLADTISKEAKILDSCMFFSLNENVNSVAETILQTDIICNRRQVTETMELNGYSIKDIANYMCKFYLDKIN